MLQVEKSEPRTESFPKGFFDSAVQLVGNGKQIVEAASRICHGTWVLATHLTCQQSMTCNLTLLHQNCTYTCDEGSHQLH